MLFVLGIGEGLDQVCVAVCSATVLGRNGAPAFDAVGSALGRGFDGLDEHVMLPSVAKVVLVNEFGYGDGDLFESRLALALHPRPTDVGTGHAEDLPSNDELMQVRVGPAEGDLKHAVQVSERRLAGHIHGSPDRRTDAAQRDLERIRRHGPTC